MELVFDDARLEEAWRPTNYSGKFYGPTRLRDALVHSIREHGAGVLLVSHELSAVAQDVEGALKLVQRRDRQAHAPQVERAEAVLSAMSFGLDAALKLSPPGDSSLVELKAICECGRKATMNLRVDEQGRAVRAGAQTEIGGNERYVALCRRHFVERLREAEARQLPLGLART